MPTGYCGKCLALRDIRDAEYTKTEAGRHVLKGRCSVCGCRMQKWAKREDITQLGGVNGH